MTNNDPFRHESHLVDILNDADGKLVGRTRMQKINYILEIAGLGAGFSFEYKHYGPYSEELSSAINTAKMFCFVEEKEVETDWGGWYSIFKIHKDDNTKYKKNDVRKSLVEKMKDVSSIELELAATALYLSREGEKDPWAKTTELKPEKATNLRLEQAKNLYRDLRGIKGLPEPFPELS